jgi:hypothetical protein
MNTANPPGTHAGNRILLDQIPSAIIRIVNERPRLQAIAKASFNAVIKERRESFLRAQTAKEGIALGCHD